MFLKWHSEWSTLWYQNGLFRRSEFCQFHFVCSICHYLVVFSVFLVLIKMTVVGGNCVWFIKCVFKPPFFLNYFCLVNPFTNIMNLCELNCKCVFKLVRIGSLNDINVLAGMNQRQPLSCVWMRNQLKMNVSSSSKSPIKQIRAFHIWDIRNKRSLRQKKWHSGQINSDSLFRFEKACHIFLNIYLNWIGVEMVSRCIDWLIHRK